MDSWAGNGGRIQGKNQLGFATFAKSPFEFSNTLNSSSVFGVNPSNSSAASGLAPPAANTGNGFGSELSGRQTHPPFGSYQSGESPFVTRSTGLAPFSFENSTSVFGKTSNSATTSPFANLKLCDSSPSVGSPFALTNLATTSPFANPEPFGSSSSRPSHFGLTNSVTISPFADINPFGPSTSGGSPFGSTNSVTSSPFANPLPLGSSTFGGSPFGLTNSATSSPFANPLPIGLSTSGGSPFGSTNSATTSPFANPNPFGSSTSGGSPFGLTNSATASPFPNAIPFGSFSSGGSHFSLTNSAPTSPFVYPKPSDSSTSRGSPFGSTSSATTSPFTNPLPFGSSTSGGSQFNSTNSATKPPFGTPLPFGSSNSGGSRSSSTNSATISPFGTQLLPGLSTSGGTSFGTSSMFSFPKSPMPSWKTSSTFNSSSFGTSAALSTGSSIMNTNSKSWFQQNISDNHVSASTVFAPFTNSNLGKSGSRGTRIKSYAITPEEGKLPDSKTGGRLLSISAMPPYKEKSHEELRLEDYQLTGKTGTKSSSGFPIINTSIPAAPSLIQGSSSSTGTVPGLSFVNIPSFDFKFLGPSVSSMSAFNVSTSVLPFCQADISTPLSTGPANSRNWFSTTQTTISIPNSGTATWFSPAPVTESITTSIPELVSTGGFNPGLGSSIDNKEQSVSQCPVSVGSIVANPFATKTRDVLPTTAVQYGISCMPVSDNAEPAKRMPLMNIRHLSLDRRRPPIEKYKPNGGEKIPFYEELPGIYKGGAALIPRENPRAWVVRPKEEQGLEKSLSLSKHSVSEHSTNTCDTGGTQYENSQVKETSNCFPEMNLSKNIKLDDNYSEKENVPVMISTDHDHEDLYISACDEDVLAIIPKLRCSEYFIKPSMDDLAANEMKRPGYCRQVKDFVVGRHGYGSIKFLGETDVRNLNLESIIQFNNREVTVYMDEKAKPPVGQGLNKPAEITLLNVKCIDKNTGKQYIDGPKVDKYKQLLMKKTAEQGAEFISFDPEKGEWRFKVEHL